MIQQESSNTYRYGIAMAFMTLISWSLVPIAIKVVVAELSPQSIGFFRLTFAALFIGLLLRFRRTLNPQRILKSAPIAMLAGVSFAGHYYFFMTSIDLGGPALAQVLEQSGTLALALSGIFLFDEKLKKVQVLGAILTLGGMFVFQHALAGGAIDPGQHKFASLLAVLSGLTWAFYGVIQKHLSVKFHSQEILLVVFATAAFVLSWTVDYDSYFEVSRLPLFVLIALGGLTVSGYWTFSEALKHAPAVQVSTIAACGPLTTLSLLQFLYYFFPQIIPAEQITMTAVFAAIATVVGLVLTVRS